MKTICAKLCALMFFAIVLLPAANAQDRVILLNGDILNCSIYKENKKFLYFKQDSKSVTSKGKISKKEVAEWTYRATVADQEIVEVESPPDFIQETKLPKQYDLRETKRKNPFRASLRTGSGLLVGDIQKSIEGMEDKGVPKADAEKYADDLIIGYTGKFTLHYQFWKDYWLGIHYNGFYSDAIMLTRLDYNDSYNWIYGEVGEKNYVNFVGPSFFSESRFGRNKRFAVHSAYTIGPVFYRNEIEIMRLQTLLTGVTLGQNLDLGLEYFIQPRWALSLDASVFASQLRKMKVQTFSSNQTIGLEKEDYNNLSRFDLSFGVVFYW